MIIEINISYTPSDVLWHFSTYGKDCGAIDEV